MFLTLEIVVQDEFPVVLRDDEIEPGPLEVAGEQQLPVVDGDRAGRSVGGNAVDMHRSTGISVRVRQIAVEFLDKVHCGSPHEG